MNKLIRLMSVALMALFFTACSSNSPEATVKSYLKDIQKGDYVAAVALMDIEDENGEFAAMMEEKGKKVIDQKGGIASFEVGKAEISEDGKKANVPYTITFGNGEKKDDKQCVKLDDGKWVIDVDK